MRPHHLLAVALFVTPLTVSATGGEEREDLARFVAGGEAATERAPHLADPEERALEAYRGYLSWMRAYEVDAEESRLCAARSLLLIIVEDEAIDADVRGDADGRLAELDGMMGASGCRPRAPVPLLMDKVDKPEPQPESQPEPLEGAEVGVNSPPVAERALRRGRRLRIAGGLSLGVGTSLLGLMTYGLIEDSRAAAEIREFEGAVLSDSDRVTIQGLGDRGRAGAQLATLAGVGAGLTLVSGAVLVLVGRKHSRQDKFAVNPGLGHITLRGRF